MQPVKGFVAGATTPSQEHGHSRPTKTQARTILVVEDDPFVRPLYRRILESAGYRILEAANGPEALLLSAAYPNRIDLLLTDLRMPGLDGFELAHRLVEHRPALRVLYVTGFVDDRASGIRDLNSNQAILEKPFLSAVLLQRVDELLPRNEWWNESQD